jgi:hypothetical protein
MTRNFQPAKILRAEGKREPLARDWLLAERRTVRQRTLSHRNAPEVVVE